MTVGNYATWVDLIQPHVKNFQISNYLGDSVSMPCATDLKTNTSRDFGGSACDSWCNDPRDMPMRVSQSPVTIVWVTDGVAASGAPFGWQLIGATTVSVVTAGSPRTESQHMA